MTWDAQHAMTDAETELKTVEAAIHRCVGEFYRQGRADPLLGPIFSAHITEWDEHLRTVEDFWSKMLLGTDRYSGFPYPSHLSLPLTPANIARWVDLFTAAARATLPHDYADKACAKARHMGESFTAGFFPFRDKDGAPSRWPA